MDVSYKEQLEERGAVAPVQFCSQEFDALSVRGVRFGNADEIWVHTIQGGFHTLRHSDQSRDEIVAEMNAARFDAWFEAPWCDDAPEELT